MTDVHHDSTTTSWPLPLLLSKQEHTGAQAQGCIVARSDLTAVAKHLATRSQRYPTLRLTLANSDAVFWSTQSVDLPWLPVAVTYLQPPINQIYIPIGWAHNLAETALDAVLSQLLAQPKDRGPLVLLPQSPDMDQSAIRIIELADSLSVSAVDWAFLSRGSA